MDLDKEIINRVRLRDKQAFSQVYDRYAPALYGVIKRMITDDHQAQDVLQEVFVKVWRNIDKWDPKRAKLFTWMYAIARNTSLDRLRKTATHSQHQLHEAYHLSGDIDTSSYAEHREVCSILSELAPKYRQVVQCLFIQGMTQREMAKETGIPLGTIKSRLSKALQMLKVRYGTAVSLMTLIMSNNG